MARRAMLIAAISVAALGISPGYSAAQTTGASAERFVLTGVLFVDGEGRGLAWLQEPTFTNNQVITARIGDSIGPYRLTRILEDQVELEGPGGKLAVPLAGGPGGTGLAKQEPSQDGPARAASSGDGALPPHPALGNPTARVIQRGDPRRNFPSTDILVGAGARVLGGAANQTAHAAAPEPAASSGHENPIPPSAQRPAPELSPHPAMNSSNATVIPRGDPRRNFPGHDLLIGY